jgi:hypothetical protein
VRSISFEEIFVLVQKGVGTGPCYRRKSNMVSYDNTCQQNAAYNSSTETKRPQWQNESGQQLRLTWNIGVGNLKYLARPAKSDGSSRAIILTDGWYSPSQTVFNPPHRQLAIPFKDSLQPPSQTAGVPIIKGW